MTTEIGSGAELGFRRPRNQRLRYCRAAARVVRAKWTICQIPFFLCLFALAAAASSPAAVAAEATATSPAAVAPPIEEWLNQRVRLRDTEQARDRPAADGKSVGEIRTGAEIQAIGLVAGKSWVEIELPNHTIAYLPRTGIEFENGGSAAAPSVSAPGAGPGSPPSPATAGTAPPPAAAPATAGGGIHGTVSKVPNAATLVVGDERIRLSGIDPGPPAVLAPFEKWVEAQGPLACVPDAQTGRYRCLTSGGIDVAQAAILNGSGRVGDGAPPAYRSSENEARNARRGLWGLP